MYDLMRVSIKFDNFYRKYAVLVKQLLFRAIVLHLYQKLSLIELLLVTDNVESFYILSFVRNILFLPLYIILSVVLQLICFVLYFYCEFSTLLPS